MTPVRSAPTFAMTLHVFERDDGRLLSDNYIAPSRR